MKRPVCFLATTILLSVTGHNAALFATEPILVGKPCALTAREGRESLKAVQMAVHEINAKGGVKGSEKIPRTLKIETIDLRDASAGVPVSEALRAGISAK